MVRPARPASNAKRQRDFQKRHPGYDARRKARQRAAAKRYAEMRNAQLAAAAEPLALPAPVEATPAPREMLALPAPVELPLFPGLNAIGRTTAKPEAEPQLLLFPAMRPAA